MTQQMDELWKNTQAINALIEDVKTQLAYRILFVSEAKAVANYAPENVKADLIQAINEAPEIPTQKQINKARAEVSEDPYNVQAIADLINLEKAADHKMMVAYLEGRRLISQTGVVSK
jgi:hypothetical protein